MMKIFFQHLIILLMISPLAAQAPKSAENLIFSYGSSGMFLYDLNEQKVIGRIPPPSGSESTSKYASWSPDGSLIMLASRTSDDYNVTFSLIDVEDFNIIWQTGAEGAIWSRPLILHDNSFAFIAFSPGSIPGAQPGRLMRLEMSTGDMEFTGGIPSTASLETEVQYLTTKKLVAICGRIEQDYKFDSWLFLVDPQSNTLTETKFLTEEQVASFRADSTETRFFCQNYQSFFILSGDPLTTEFVFEHDCHEPFIPPPDNIEPTSFIFMDVQYANKAGVLVYQVLGPLDCYGNIIYWDTRDRLEPLRGIDIAGKTLVKTDYGDMYVYKSPFPFTVSPDGEKVWIPLSWGIVGANFDPGIIQFDLTTRSFLDTLPVTGLEEGENLGNILAYQKPSPFISRINGDINDDGNLDILDLITFLQAWQAGFTDAETHPEMDVETDGKINIFDLLTLLKLIGS